MILTEILSTSSLSFLTLCSLLASPGVKCIDNISGQSGEFEIGIAALTEYTESGDAGGSLSTAQSVAAPTSGVALTSLSGSLTLDTTVPGSPGTTDLVDLFKVHLDGSAFSATLSDQSLFGLYLFDSSGLGVIGAQVRVGSSQPPRLSAENLVAGDYYLGISLALFPESAAGPIFPSTLDGSQSGPTGPGGALPLEFFSGSIQSTVGTTPYHYPYTVSLTGTQFVTQPVPEPATGSIGAWAIGLFALSLRNRQGQQT